MGSAKVRTGAEAVRAALQHRVAVVQAAAGSGKTTAVRAALGQVAPAWYDAATLNREELIEIASLEDRLIVVDDLHALAADASHADAIGALVDRYPKTRWVFISRRQAGLPIATWIANGEAGAPVEQRDLLLTPEEIRRIGQSLSVRVDPAAMQFLADATGGWPVAVRFGLAALGRSSLDLSRAGATLRRLLSAYFEAEILGRMELSSRELLADLALLGTFDEGMLVALGREDPSADLHWLGVSAIPHFEDAASSTLHPAFAQHMIAQIPRAERPMRALRAAEALRGSGFFGRAFDVIRRYAPDEAPVELQRQGFALLDAGCRNGVEEVVRALPQAVRRNDPVVVTLRAELEAQEGALDRANALFERARQIETTIEIHALICRRQAVHYLNQSKAEAVDAIRPALEAGTDAEKMDARGIYAMTLALTGQFDEARAEATSAVAFATRVDDEALLARSLQRISYVEFQAGNVADAERFAREAARLAERLGAWFYLVCAHSVLCSAAIGMRDDHAAALKHAQQAGWAAERMGDRRYRLYALSAQYVLEVERGRRTRALAIESEIPLHSGFRDELDFRIALATRLSWSGELGEACRTLSTLDVRMFEAAERRLWNAALAMFAAFGDDEKTATLHLRACGKVAAAANRENATINDLADCYVALAQLVLGQAEAAIRRLPTHPSSAQARALASFARELAALGSSLGTETASTAIARLRASRQEGMAQAVAAALASLPGSDGSELLTEAERRVLLELANGRTAQSIAQTNGRSIHTVRNQIKAATRKLGASGSLEAVARANQMGLLR